MPYTNDQRGAISWPRKLTCRLSRKVGTPNYGSLCASCAVEFTIDGGLQPRDQEGFQRQVRNAYAACRDAIVQENMVY